MQNKYDQPKVNQCKVDLNMCFIAGNILLVRIITSQWS